MKHTTRVVIALVILISGLALVPLVGMPAQAFGWQRYAGAYQPDLAINHISGRTGSYFRITGSGFLPDSLATVRVNGIVVGTVPTDGAGALDFSVSTNQADLGSYTVTVSGGASDSVQFILVPGGPLWPQQGVGPVLFVPTVILYLPVISR
jgi:hypothetical protein